MSSTNTLSPPNSVEDNHKVVLLPTYPKLQGLLPCYNQFLLYYNLPFLNYNQTIKSFLSYLQSHKFDHNTIFSYNSELNEAHIYIPNNLHLLNDHFFIEMNQLALYLNSPLKSNTSTITNLPLNLNTNPSPLPHTNSNLNLNIVTHNVQGFNVLTKRQLWEEYCLKENFNIASITETKLNTSRSQKFLKTKNFSYF